MKHQSSVAFQGVHSLTPVNEPLSAKYTKSFAYFTIKERLPVILTTIVDQLARNKEEITKDQITIEDDLKNCIGQISKLKNEVQTNKNFMKLNSNGDDVEQWNKFIVEQTGSDSGCWFESPWLFAECYMYRRLREIFENSESLRDFDYFAYHKIQAFEKSFPDMKILATFLEYSITKQDKAIEEEYFLSLIKACLWGNRCDLSISAGSQIADGRHSLNYIKTLDTFLLHDDSSSVYKLLDASQNAVIDYVMDNSGYESFSDFCFCDYLCSRSLASRIRFHVKRFPWYVSDSTVADIKAMLSKVRDFGLVDLSERWENYFVTSVWTIHDESFWTLPVGYDAMKSEDPGLYALLRGSSLIVFKGDLNYRKLLRDINWNLSEKFDLVLGGFRPSNILTLRTIKSDLACGLLPVNCENLSADLEWMRTGEFATIQLIPNK